jgi:hypothetical protein
MPTKSKPQSKRVMTNDHKEKLAIGRNQSRVVNKYLEAIVAGRGKRGRKRTPESVSMQIARIDNLIINSTAVQRLALVQRRFDLVEEKERLNARVDLTSLEKDFIKIAKSYARRNGISYVAFREMGVSADVLKAAGIGRAEN